MRTKKRLITAIWTILLIMALAVPQTVYAEPDFPQVAAVNGGSMGADNVNHTVNLPAGIAAGDLLLVFFASDGAPTITFPAGWTGLFQVDSGGEVVFGVWYRIADGTEGATITATTSDYEQSAHTSYLITGYSGTPEALYATAASDYPDPPELTPSWGADDTLWFAACGYDDGTRTVTTYPADYSNGRNDRTTYRLGCGVGSGRRELNADSENPVSFHISESEEWVAATVAIRGEAPLVGGTAYPINTLAILAPWIGLAIVIAAGGFYLVRRRVNN